MPEKVGGHGRLMLGRRNGHAATGAEFWRANACNAFYDMAFGGHIFERLAFGRVAGLVKFRPTGYIWLDIVYLTRSHSELEIMYMILHDRHTDGVSWIAHATQPVPALKRRIYATNPPITVAVCRCPFGRRVFGEQYAPLASHSPAT